MIRQSLTGVIRVLFYNAATCFITLGSNFGASGAVAVIAQSVRLTAMMREILFSVSSARNSKE
jgi:hypothetical protein